MRKPHSKHVKRLEASGLDWRDWLITKSDVAALRDGWFPHPELSQHVVDFFHDNLRHSKGRWAAQSFDLLPWELSFINRLFAWAKIDARGQWLRRFRRSGVWIAKKNGKSTLASGLVLYLLCADGEPGAEVYGAAVDRRQAQIVFGECVSMVKKSPRMEERLVVNQTNKRIVYERQGSFYQALSKEAGTAEGVNAHGVICDELHAWKNRDLYDTLRYAGVARTQPLEVTISTAGVHDPESIGYEQYQYAKMVLDGAVVDTGFLPVIYEVGKDEDWTDRKLWPNANPSIGHTVDLDEMEQEFEAAQRSIVAQNRFRRYRLNQWVAQEVRWIDLARWHDAEREFSADDLDGYPCWAGLDLASRKDTTAYVLIFPPRDGESLYYVLPWFWVPRDSLQNRTHEEAELMRSWEQSGHLIITDGSETDYAKMREVIFDTAKRYDLLGIAYDPHNATSDTIGPIRDQEINCIEHGQGIMAITAPSKKFETAVLDGTLAHNGHPVMTWQVNQVEVRVDSNENIKPVRTGKRRIDGVIAGIMALNMCMTQEAPQPSQYESRGMEVI